jgi:hypothetical protein
LIASNRPWVELTAIKVTRLEVKKDQVLVWVDFSFRNIGHSPAQVVSIFPELLIPEAQPWGFKEARRICADIANHPRMLAGNLERFWLGDAAHERGGGPRRPGPRR